YTLICTHIYPYMYFIRSSLSPGCPSTDYFSPTLATVSTVHISTFSLSPRADKSNPRIGTVVFRSRFQSSNRARIRLDWGERIGKDYLFRFSIIALWLARLSSLSLSLSLSLDRRH